MIQILILILFLLPLLILMISYNQILRARRRTEEALATMESLRQKLQILETRQAADGAKLSSVSAASDQAREELAHAKEELEYALRYFNGCARDYNQRISLFPGNVVANLFQFSQAQLYAGNDFEE